MFQTWWDINKQNVRKVVDTLSGAVAGWLASQGEWGAMAIPIVALAINYAWFWFDNKNKVTVKGLDKAGMTGAALAVEDAIVLQEKKDK